MSKSVTVSGTLKFWERWKKFVRIPIFFGVFILKTFSILRMQTVHTYCDSGTISKREYKYYKAYENTERLYRIYSISGRGP